MACRAFVGGPKECTDPRERPGGTAMEKGDVRRAPQRACRDVPDAACHGASIQPARHGCGASVPQWLAQHGARPRLRTSPSCRAPQVAWAGGSAGPDFFIMMSRSGGFGGTHTVWGSLADEESMALALKLVRGASSSKPGTMRILDEPVRFTIAGADA